MRVASPQSAEAAALRFALPAALALVVAKLALHAATSLWRYGFFRDELYYLDLARHLDWGYTDTAPLIAVYARLALLLGGSLPDLRILPAVAGAALIPLTMLIARELGGNRHAQWLAGLCVLLAPGFLLLGSILTMNAFEPLFWTGCIWLLARIVRTGDSRLWIWFGVLAGLGLQNKHSTLFFGFAVFVALLLTEQRREFLNQWVWLGGALALLILLPNIVWQVQHGYPTLETLENVRRTGKNVALSPAAFFGQQILAMGPPLFPVWLLGAIHFFRHRQERIFGWIFLVFLLSMILMHAKIYYAFPIYPMVLAGGAVAIERWTAAAKTRRWALPAAAVLVTVLSFPLVPLVVPALSPEGYVSYTETLGFTPPRAEVGHRGALPQPFGDQFGWEEMAREVGQIYNSLPPEVKARTGILAGNYGEAGAINHFGPRYGLPRAYSGHQNHFFWGPPAHPYQDFIVIQWDREDVEEHCASWEAPVNHFHPWGMAEENRPIYLCRGAKFDIREVWPRLKHWN